MRLGCAVNEQVSSGQWPDPTILATNPRVPSDIANPCAKSALSRRTHLQTALSAPARTSRLLAATGRGAIMNTMKTFAGQQLQAPTNGSRVNMLFKRVGRSAKPDGDSCPDDLNCHSWA